MPNFNSLKALVKSVIGSSSRLDYRETLFTELLDYLDGESPGRILEIGPKDGKDTARLLTLNPDELVLIDLPGKEEKIRLWLDKMRSPCIFYLSANFMYSREIQDMEAFDLIWCTGVLYHNPEQLRMIRKLHDLMKPYGVLVLESATTRRRQLRREQCVEIIYPPSEEYKRKHHISMNVTHLPSASAIEAWLAMTGFANIRRSACHARNSRSMKLNRAAYIMRRYERQGDSYYKNVKGDKYIIGKAL